VLPLVAPQRLPAPLRVSNDQVCTVFRTGMAKHGMASHGTALHGMEWNGVAWRGMAWHGMA